MTADRTRFHLPAVDARNLGRFAIKVMMPILEKGGRERFPVVYMTDANTNFESTRAISLALQRAGHVARFILVGIGYPGDNPLVGELLRYRDLTSPRRPI